MLRSHHRHYRDNRLLAIAALALAISGAFAAVLLPQASTQDLVVYVYPSRPPGFEDILWPQMEPSLVTCRDLGRQIARARGGVTEGTLRWNGRWRLLGTDGGVERWEGRWEIMSGGDFALWTAFDRRFPREAQEQYRYGPCWVGGPIPRSNSHSEPTRILAEMKGVSVVQLRRDFPIEVTDLQFCDSCVRAVYKWEEEHGGGDGEPVATPTPRPTPAPACRPPCTLRAGGICDCPDVRPTPSPLPTPTPTPSRLTPILNRVHALMATAPASVRPLLEWATARSEAELARLLRRLHTMAAAESDGAKGPADPAAVPEAQVKAFALRVAGPWAPAAELIPAADMKVLYVEVAKLWRAGAGAAP